MSESDSSVAVEYRPIPGFPGYQAGDDGTLWSCWKLSGGRATGGSFDNEASAWVNTGIRQRQLKPQPYGKYWKNLVSVNGKKVKLAIHTAVLLAFVGPCPPGLECRHLDGNQSNNTRGNLAWGTKKENAADKLRHGVDGNAKLTEIQVRAIRASAQNVSQLAEQYGVTIDSIYNILARRTWTHLE